MFKTHVTHSDEWAESDVNDLQFDYEIDMARNNN